MNIESWKLAVRRLEEETYALYPAYRDPRTPWYARIFAALLIGYGFFSIDPILGFIPVVGLLDEMVAVPLGVIAARKMIPGEVFDGCRERSREIMKEGKKPVSRAAAVVVVAVWLLMAVLGTFLALRMARELGVGT